MTADIPCSPPSSRPSDSALQTPAPDTGLDMGSNLVIKSADYSNGGPSAWVAWSRSGARKSENTNTGS